MEQILTALIAAASLIAKDTASEVIKDTYHHLKDLIKGRIGPVAGSELILDSLDTKPEVWAEPARDLLAGLEIDKDSEIVKTATQLSELIGSTQVAVGDHLIQFGPIMNFGGVNYITGGDVSSEPYGLQVSAETHKDKAAVLLACYLL